MGTREIQEVDAYLTSPPYDTSKTHCLSFEYEVVREEITGRTVSSPTLNVYSRCQPNVFAGEKIWSASHISRGVTKITILANKRTVDCYIDFVGRLYDVETDKVALANVRFNEGLCDDRESVVCQDGEFMCEDNLTCGSDTFLCDDTSHCQIDTQKLKCGEHCQGFLLIKYITAWLNSHKQHYTVDMLPITYLQHRFSCTFV